MTFLVMRFYFVREEEEEEEEEDKEEGEAYLPFSACTLLRRQFIGKKFIISFTRPCTQHNPLLVEVRVGQKATRS